MDSLPQEILVHILRFLPLSSRKRVRRVNKSWNNAYWDPLIQKREQLFTLSVDDYPYHVREFFETLVASNRTIFNLEFPDSDATDLFSSDNVSSYFWQNYGTRVRSLGFGTCTTGSIKADRLFEILKCCPNLNEFRLLFTDSRFNDLFKLLCDNNVILEKVAFLSVRELSFDDTSSCLFENLIKVFPNVRKLNIAHIITDYEYNDIFCPTWDYVLTVSPNLQYLDLGCKLHTNRNSSDLCEVDSLTKILAAVKQIKTLKIDELSFLTRFHIIQIRDLKNLSTLCINTMAIRQSACELINELLDNLPKLRHLEMTGGIRLGWNNYDLEKLVTSPLETLKIMEISKINDHVDIMADNGIYNDTLKNLIINYSDGSISESIGLFFVKRFRKLQTLSFGEDVTLRNLMRNLRIHQMNLHTLTVSIKTEDYSHSYSHGPELFSFRQFQYLEVLNLVMISDFSQQYSFSDFVLPRLRYLKVRFNMVSNSSNVNPFNLINFMAAIEKLSNLELLELRGYCGEIPMDLFLRLCQSLKNLKGLSKRPTERPSMAEYAKLSNLFTVCDSLQWITYGNQHMVKNIISKEIIFSDYYYSSRRHNLFSV